MLKTLVPGALLIALFFTFFSNVATAQPASACVRAFDELDDTRAAGLEIHVMGDVTPTAVPEFVPNLALPAPRESAITRVKAACGPDRCNCRIHWDQEVPWLLLVEGKAKPNEPYFEVRRFRGQKTVAWGSSLSCNDILDIVDKVAPIEVRGTKPAARFQDVFAFLLFHRGPDLHEGVASFLTELCLPETCGCSVERDRNRFIISSLPSQ